MVCDRYSEYFAENGGAWPTGTAAELPITTFKGFNMYDADGNCLMTPQNMKVVAIPQSATTLASGEYTYDPEHKPSNAGNATALNALNNCFTDDATQEFGINSAKPKYNLNDEQTWAGIVWRLPEGSADPVYFDFNNAQGLTLKSGVVSSGYRAPTAWVLQGSVDGVGWERILEKNDQVVYGKAWTWASDGKDFCHQGDNSLSGNKEARYQHSGMALPSIASPGIADYLENPGTLSVGNGAVVEIRGEITFSALRLDVVNGAGTFDGATFASDGTIDLVGGKSDVSATIVNSPSLANVANWEVTCNGRPSAYRVIPSATGFRVIKPGLRLIVR